MSDRRDMAATHAALRTALAAAQNDDGGYGAHAGLPSATEPTALAVFALSFEPDAPSTEAPRAWLRGQQMGQRGWPVMTGLPDPGWATALAVLALARYPGDLAAARGGADWLVGQQGKTIDDRPGWLAWMVGRKAMVELNGSLVGWPWLADTFSWVEPTAYALLALRAIEPQTAAAAARIGEGERLLLDRVCPDGGWNYGNARVLGENLWSYPDTTALALLALGPHADAGVSAKAAGTLESMLADNRSGLATALGILALGARGHDVSAWRERLATRFGETAFLGEVRSLAWAVLASNVTAAPFGGVANG